MESLRWLIIAEVEFATMHLPDNSLARRIAIEAPEFRDLVSEVIAFDRETAFAYVALDRLSGAYR